MRRASSSLSCFFLRKTKIQSKKLPKLHPLSHLHHPSPSLSQKLPSCLVQTFFFHSQTVPHSHTRTSQLDLLDGVATKLDIIAAIKTLEDSLSSSDEVLGLSYLKAAKKTAELYAAGDADEEDYQVTLDFALRALTIFENSGGRAPVVAVAEALYLLGLGNFKLGKLNNSLESLEAVGLILLDSEINADPDARRVSLAVESQLWETKIAMGKRFEALHNLKRALELKELILEPGSRALVDEYKRYAEACISVLDFEEALSICLKALEIYTANFGEDSTEVAGIRRILGVAYIGIGESKKALMQFEISRRLLESLGFEDLLFEVNIEAARVLIDLGRLDEAINTLKEIIQKTDKENGLRATVFALMAKAMFDQEKFADSKRCLEIASGILDKKETETPKKVAEIYAEVSMLYEAMSEFEMSISLMMRTLAILEKIQMEQHLEGSISARLGWLLLLTGRVAQAVPYLESAVERLKGSFGPKHFGLGFVYKHLGHAYLEMDRPQPAIKVLLLAKDIIFSCFGSQHQESVDASQYLANAYGATGSYNVAMKFQQQVVDAWESLGTVYSDEYREAHRLLEQLKKKAQGSPSAVFPANTLPMLPRK